MGGANVRTSCTGRGTHFFCPWTNVKHIYSAGQINIGNNSISRLEVVSALNVFNLATYNYHYNQSACTEKFNLKAYLSAIQTIANGWDFDIQNTGKWAQTGPKKVAVGHKNTKAN